MAVLINFKICDNAEECAGIETCPSGALSWDDENKTIKIDNEKCTSCGACEKACGVEAIKVARTDAEYAQITKEFDEDPRTVNDLMVDRYGAQIILPFNLIDDERFEIDILKSEKLAVVELFKNDTIECMIKSIPIKELLAGYDYKYRKLEVKNEEIMKKYDISQLPALLFFRNGKLIGKVEEYFTTDQKSEIIAKIKEIMN
ncbi:MAG: 4Fe-4S binding protein [Patescibacteria group bacterium]|jgi:NAD-dependent dihydropyrimidine dehydrogenase PreA subunit